MQGLGLLKVNTELLSVYWEVGNTIFEQQKHKGWGARIVGRLAADLRMGFPDMKGFSVRNLKYMRSFADAYPDFIIVQQSAAETGIPSQNVIVQHPAL